MPSKPEDIIIIQKDLAEELKRLLENFKKDGAERKTEEYLQNRLKRLETIWADFNDRHLQLTECAKPEHPYFTDRLYERTHELFKQAVELIANYQIPKKYQRPITSTSALKTTMTTPTLPVTTTAPSPPAVTATAGAPAVSNFESINTLTATPQNLGYNPQFNTLPSATTSWNLQQQNLDQIRVNNYPKLPPIQIPKFSGDYKDWKSFIDIFKNVIHNNLHISNIEKMQYLLYHLEGDARRVISHLQFSSQNYETALHLIEARFNNNRKIITTYVNTIMDAKNVEYRSQQDIIMLYDTIRECLEALKLLNYKTDEWSPIIVCIAMRKLDAESLRLFEESLLNPREMPLVTDLLRFLEKRYQVLECIENSKRTRPGTSKCFKKAFHTTLRGSCMICNKEHKLYQCGEFRKWNVDDRQALVKQKDICGNCLAHNKNEKCKSNKLCAICNKRHHTLLHKGNQNSPATPGISHVRQNQTMGTNMSTNMCSVDKAQPSHPKGNAISCHTNKVRMPNVLLPTAIIRIKNIYGQLESFRALIDPGSQVSLITEQAVQFLKLRKDHIRATIFGVGEAESARSSSKVKLSIQLKDQTNSYLFVDALVLHKLNSLLPEAPLPGINMKKFKNMNLADPTFYQPGPIDILLGADVYANIIIKGFKKTKPLAQNTKLGWIIFGSVPNSNSETLKLASFLSLAEIEESLEKFWDIDNNHVNLEQNNHCEEHFKHNYRRDATGRYEVSLPFKQELGELGDSKCMAIARLRQIEKRLEREPELSVEYNAFLKEYLAMGHMSPAKPYAGKQSDVYYLPHHAVLKTDSSTTKLRVVFDASCKSRSGLSLNDLLHCGPKIQQDLTQIILRWRKHRYVYTADIEKMFRQINIKESDRNYQRILWRQHPTEPIQEFKLNTVTYGTSPATYLAVRTLKQLAKDEGSNYPIAREILSTDFYVDDMLTGADTKSEALQLQEQTIALLRAGGFNLRKWTANDDGLLRTIPEEIIEQGIMEIKEHDTIKTLGIHWNPIRDEFRFKLKTHGTSNSITKRTLLSKIASIFDPLGWLAPVTITAKLIMQSLCREQTDWDREAPLEVTKAWQGLERELAELEKITIPRWINYRRNNEIQLHGFCDASEKGCAAVVYARTTDCHGKTHVTMLTAKTKVVPLKQKISLPRLELSGAALLANLLTAVINTLDIQPADIFAWCDSEITLAWIAKNPTTWNTYVANRVADIQGHFPKNIWRHVPSRDNPADAATRGISPKKLTTHDIWWRGPLWLSQTPEAWPQQKLKLQTNEESKRHFQVLTSQVSNSEIFKCSTLTRQLRVMAYCRRFIGNCRRSMPLRDTGYLTSEELQQAKLCIVRIVQREAFNEDLSILERNKTLMNSSKLLSLNPFLDKEGILRVGGRIKHSTLAEDTKHQMLLPQKHHATNLIIDHAHQQTLHGGTQLTLNYLRSQYWVINAKRTVQSRIHRCITCLRHRQASPQQLMGNLPAIRITPAPPFSHCGIDYAGPFITKMAKGRGTKTLKGYISLFICMVTKAVHLELVSDLTSDAFLAAYRRFVSRRGNAKQIFSDNGTNFVGAHNKLDKDLKEAITQSTKYVAEITANDGTEWSFIPPGSPHLGGLWEAGVKSVKTHLKRVLSETLLTYEEFTTVIYRVEACLNSRPIGQQSSDPQDLEALTPGHFLIGRPLLAPPEPDITDTKMHDKWKQLTKFHQEIWQRWSAEYLTTLQQRSKWKTKRENPNIGELVLVKDDNLPPQKWALGRIVELHPGEDNVVRIVSVQYRNGIKKRPLNKLCQLPLNIHDSEAQTPSLKVSTTVTTSSDSESRPRKRPREHEQHINVTSPNNPELLKDNNTQKALNSPIKIKKRKVAPCAWAAKFLHTTLLILYWITVVVAQDYTIFQPKPGLYIENLGHAQVKRGNLRLQITFPTDEAIQDQKKIDSTWERVKEMCEKNKILTDITHCEVLFQHLTTKRQGLLKSTSQIINFIQQRHRSRRGIFGRLLTGIFGVNDEVYLEIEHLQHNQDNILQSTNQQVLFLNQRINRSNTVIEETLKHFDARLEKAVGSINEMATWYSTADHNRVSIEVLSTYISAENYYNELQSKYNNWINALHEHAHLLDFITSQDIDELIKNVSIKLGADLLIDRTPQHRLEVNANNGTLKLYGYLSIIEKNLYDLMHITSIPQLISNDSFAVANLKSSTFAVNFNHETYFNLEEEELKACKISGSHVYRCAPTIIHNIDNSPSCVIDEIYGRHTKNMCEMQHLSLNGIVWKTLMMENTWLYVTTKARIIATVCKGVREEILINTTGIIHLNDGCFIKTKEVTLKTTIDERFDVITSHIMETPPVAASLNSSKAPRIIQPGLLIRPSEQFLDYSLHPDLLQMKDVQGKFMVYSISTATVVIVVLLIVLLAYNYGIPLKNLCTTCKYPPSKPRRQSISGSSIQKRFDAVLANAGPQHVQLPNRSNINQISEGQYATIN